MDTKIKTERIYSILELNTAEKDILKREFPDTIWVHGEIQDYNKSRHKQHIFFRLCEKHPEIDEIIAHVTVVIFRRTKEKIARILKQAENRFELQDDIEVKFLCRIDLYPKTGKFMLIVENIDPVYTLGKLAQNKQKIINDLKVKGTLDKNRRLPFPVVPLNIGLITSYNSAAFHDFTSELKKSKYSFKIQLFDSSMQGKNVEQDVCRALQIFDKLNLDAVVITRGGGSTADLSWFDNAKIAERIASSSLPVLSGIGHEINITIADLASHTHMKTPTAIAQFLIRNIETFLMSIEDKTKEIIEVASNQVQNDKQELRMFSVNLAQATNAFLRTHREDIVNKISTLKLGTKNLIKHNRTRISNLSGVLSLQARQILKNFRKNIEYVKETIAPKKLLNMLLRQKAELQRKKGVISKISKNVVNFSIRSLRDKQMQLRMGPLRVLRSAERNIRNYEKATKIADPFNTIKRGFSITRTKHGRAIRSVKDVKVKENIITTVLDGNIQSEVKGKE